ncbi:MAG TPA: signal recognition particle receptor subunit alpha, partial [Bdellovibrionales bacterium]|nr:signal recognition particle receptor subunit alpha [Bdellovibrionales bacterium]
MFDRLSDRLLKSIKTLRGQGRITEANIQDTLKEIRLSLLEADVNFQVVKTFIDRVKAKALGQEVIGDVSAGQQFVKIVHEELVTILGGGAARLELKSKPSVLFLVGLQGSGKTTTASKLALYIRKQLSKKPGLISVDVYRPAAIEQLRVLAEKNGLPFFTTTETKPEAILQAAKRWAEQENVEVVILDTAGRLQIDEELMGELARLKDIWTPDEVILVADAMLGQQSVNVAEGFHKRIGLSGLVLTKVDGDARGGAALSIREATGVPIKFLGIGEKSDALEVFHPDRLASRILDMGDVL